LEEHEKKAGVIQYSTLIAWIRRQIDFCCGDNDGLHLLLKFALEHPVGLEIREFCWDTYGPDEHLTAKVAIIK